MSVFLRSELSKMRPRWDAKKTSYFYTEPNAYLELIVRVHYDGGRK